MLFIILKVISMTFLGIVSIMIVWNMFETENIYDKVSGGLMLVLIILRLLSLK